MLKTQIVVNVWKKINKMHIVAGDTYKNGRRERGYSQVTDQIDVNVVVVSRMVDQSKKLFGLLPVSSMPNE